MLLDIILSIGSATYFVNVVSASKAYGSNSTGAVSIASAFLGRDVPVFGRLYDVRALRLAWLRDLTAPLVSNLV